MKYILIVLIVLLILSACQNYQTEGTADIKSMQIEFTEQQKIEAEKTPEGMVYIPEGEYISGSPKEEKKFWLSAFYIDKYEVTNKQFQDFIAKNPQWQKGNVNLSFQAGRYLAGFGRYIGNKGTPTNILVEDGERYVVFSDGTKEPITLENYNWNEAREERYNYPVAWVSWFAADAYCKSMGKRLPTSWEWEKAGRGTDGRMYPWGNKFKGDNANYCDESCTFWFKSKSWNDGFSESAPVGPFPNDKSPYGVYDMAGNVQEWAADWAPPRGIDTTAPNSRDPRGPETGLFRVVLGRSWGSVPTVGFEIYVRGGIRPEATVSQLGFRCATDVE